MRAIRASGTIATQANIATRMVVATNSGSCSQGNATFLPRPAWSFYGETIARQDGQVGNVSCCRLRTPRDETLIAEVMARFGMSREEAIEELILNGGI